MRFAGFLFIILLVLSAIPSRVSGTDSTSVKKIKVYPLPAIGYTPETRWYIGAVALFNIRFSNDTLIKPSAFKAEFNITQNKQWILTANYDLRLKKEKIILSGTNGYYKFPEDYWGVGVSTTDADKVRYDAKRLELDNSVLIKAYRHYYAGLRYRYHHMGVEDYVPETGEFTDFSSEYTTGGLGITMLADYRDNVFNPRKGYYFNASALFFDPAFGGNYSYRRYDADFRYYFPVFKKALLASQLLIAVNEGGAPFRMLPMIGNESTMRGYYNGRYRDSGLTALQVEYRTPVWRWLGLTGFAGGATLFNRNTDSFGATILPNYGGGIRVRVDKKDNINLRFDYGAGKKSGGFYVAFAEAF